MATISFYVDPAPASTGATGTLIGGGSGLGFYGDAGFGASVAVGAYQGRTFVTNSTGTAQGTEADNIKYLNAGSGILGSTGSGIGVGAWPYTQASLMIKFENESTVRVQNPEIRIYNRSDIATGAVGVTTKMAEIVHPWSTQQPSTDGSGVNDGIWYTPAGDSVTMSLSPSPGPTGLFVGGGVSSHSSTVHDWFIGISASPDSIGSKTEYGLYVSLEYL
tara:strand:- start:3442 stop:4098 length:657 start_codon:yes stop_codon:yes gene_type:complete